MLACSFVAFDARAGFDEAWNAFNQGNYSEALNQCRQPADDGDGDCMSLIGNLHEHGVAGFHKDLAKAAESHRSGAKTNSRRAQYYYGLALLYGTGVPKDTKQGVELITKSSLQGYLLARVQLAILHFEGEEVELDEMKAFELAKGAADEGFPEGNNLLGYILQFGKSFGSDLKQAAVHYRKAAEQGYPGALNNLGLLYKYGAGVPMDWVVAYVLFELSTALGFEKAPANLAMADAVLTKAQIEEAKSLASDWKFGKPLPSKSKTWVQPAGPQRPVPTMLPGEWWLGKDTSGRNTEDSFAWNLARRAQKLTFDYGINF